MTKRQFADRQARPTARPWDALRRLFHGPTWKPRCDCPACSKRWIQPKESRLTSSLRDFLHHTDTRHHPRLRS